MQWLNVGNVEALFHRLEHWLKTTVADIAQALAIHCDFFTYRQLPSFHYIITMLRTPWISLIRPPLLPFGPLSS